MNRRERQEWHWNYEGFETLAKNRLVADWIKGLDADDPEAMEALFDVLSPLQKLPNDEWSAQDFKPLEDGISEIRFKTSDHKYRIYGCFGSGQTYIMLVGTDKKVGNQKDAKDLARKRRGQIQRREARTHPFLFEF